MAEFKITVVPESKVVTGQRGREAKPMLADAFEPLVSAPVKHEGKEYTNLLSAVKAGYKSSWYLMGDASEVKVRSAAKYHGLSVQVAKSQDDKPVFRFNAVFVPRPRGEKGNEQAA